MKPVARRQGRARALQMLCWWDAEGGTVEQVTSTFWREFRSDEDPNGFANELVRGCIETHADLDARIAEASTHWRTDRMSVVDRNILRLGVYEICSVEDTPVRVALNEAIELAKRFGAEGSASFINGLLDRVAREHGSVE